MASLKEDIETYLGIPIERIENDLLNPPEAHPTMDDIWAYYMSDKYAYFMLRSVVKGEDLNLPSMQQLLSDIVDMQQLDDYRILVYGCGEGFIPLGLTGMNFKDITVADIPNKHFGFFKFISDKLMLNWKFISIERQREYPLEKEYDFIICNDTVGMELDPETTLLHLTKHLANFGYIYLGSDNPFKGDTYAKILEGIGLQPKHKDGSGFRVFRREPK